VAISGCDGTTKIVVKENVKRCSKKAVEELPVMVTT
jgi:hypothetical protein